jgi:hypothetical protein
MQEAAARLALSRKSVLCGGMSSALTVEDYLAKLPDNRREPMTTVLKMIRRNLPKGFEERMHGGMICWEVPPAVYTDPASNQPVLFAALASQKNHMAAYFCSLYLFPELRERLEEGYVRAGIRLDCGAGFIRFRKLHHVALPVIGKLTGAVSMKEFVAATKAAHEARKKQ